MSIQIETSSSSMDVFTEIVTMTDLEIDLASATTEEMMSSRTPITYRHRAVVSGLLLFVSLAGLVGNGLVIVSVSLSKKLQTPTNVLVISLAIADLVTCLVIPVQICVLLSRDAWPLPEVVCVVVVYVSYTAMCCSVLTLAAIAVIRWYVITHMVHGTHGINTYRSMTVVAIILWIASSLAMIIPPSMGIGSVGYSDYYHLCSVTDYNPLGAFYVLIQAAIILFALTITAIFYILILYFVLKSTKSFQSKFNDAVAETRNNNVEGADGDKGERKMTKFNKREIAITKNLFVVVCVFVVCIIPQGVNFIIPGASVFTLYSGVAMSVNSALNPVIYGLKHPNFGEVFRCILTCNLGGIPQPSRLVRGTLNQHMSRSNASKTKSTKTTNM